MHAMFLNALDLVVRHFNF